MPTVLPFVRGDLSAKAKRTAKDKASGSGSGSSSGGGMKKITQKFGGGGGGQQSSPGEMASQLAGKRLIPGQGLPHVTLHTVQVSRFS